MTRTNFHFSWKRHNYSHNYQFSAVKLAAVAFVKMITYLIFNFYKNFKDIYDCQQQTLKLDLLNSKTLLYSYCGSVGKKSCPYKSIMRHLIKRLRCSGWSLNKPLESNILTCSASVRLVLMMVFEETLMWMFKQGRTLGQPFQLIFHFQRVWSH